MSRPRTTDDTIMPPSVTITIHVPNLSSLDEVSESEAEEYGALKGYLVLDEVKETENVATSEFPAEREIPVVIAEELPSVFDSHYHLDRTDGKLLGHKGHSAEDLIRFNGKDRSAGPGVRVKLEGGIVV